MGRESTAESHSSLAVRLERLFAATHPPHALERPWRGAEVAAACREQGYDLSETNLSALRRGKKTNPTMRTLHALSWFFGVGVSYFTDEQIPAEFEALLVEREAGLARAIEQDRDARSEAKDATKELQQALRAAGAEGMAQRGVGAASLRQRTRMMRALTDALTSEPDDPDPSDATPGLDTR